MIAFGRGAPPMPGRHAMSLWLGDLQSNQHVELKALSFEMIKKDRWGNGQIPPQATPMWWPSTYEFHRASTDDQGGPQRPELRFANR